MRATATLLLTGLALCVASLSGCASTGTSTTAMGTTAMAPALSETASQAGADAGYAVLPETVAVLPQPSGRVAMADAATAAASAPAQAAALPEANGAQPVLALAPPVKPGEAMPALETAAATAAPVNAAFPPAPTAAQAEPAVGAAPVIEAAYVKPAVPAVPLMPSEGSSYEIDRLIAKYAAVYEVPVDLVRHVVKRESTFNPRAYNKGHWGLMQIKHATARGMGYDGPPSGLFDAETNLKYAVKYLRGAWLVADRDAKRADWLYQTGYYYQAKAKGMLEETGLGVDRIRRHRLPGA